MKDVVGCQNVHLAPCDQHLLSFQVVPDQIAGVLEVAVTERRVFDNGRQASGGTIAIEFRQPLSRADRCDGARSLGEGGFPVTL